MIIITKELIMIMEDTNTLFCSSKLPGALASISSKFFNNLGTRPQQGSPALA
jgi:hypothetical protein